MGRLNDDFSVPMWIFEGKDTPFTSESINDKTSD